MTRQFSAKLQDVLQEFMGGCEADSTTAKQLMSINDDLCFIWSPKEHCILAIRLDDGETKCTKLIPTDTPLFDVEKITLSVSGRWICVWGGRGASAMEIPRRSGKLRNFVGAESDGSVVVHSIPIAERFFMCNTKVVLQQALWHPGSTYDGHIVILTSDNALRIFNLDSDQEGGATPEQTLFLSGKDQANDTTSKRFFGESALTVKGSLGETAVSFAFAPPVGEAISEDTAPHLWPIFILSGDGSVYFIVTSLNASHAGKPSVMGPLPMLPEAEDNYGSDACAIICLHPMISSPPILVIATASGTLYHCIVLQKLDDDATEVSSQISDWSTTIGNDNIPAELNLHVYESIELELSLVNKEEHSQKPFDYPLLLTVDPLSPSRYFCSHKAGVHCVSLPMVAQLAEMVQCPDDTLAKGMPPMEQSSIVQHLVCTQLFSQSSAAPVQGLALSFPPAKLHCILNDFKAVTIPLTRSVVSEPQPLLCADDPSPVSKNVPKEAFDKHIALILQRNTNNPLMKAPSSSSMTTEECYEILARSTKVLREEYLSKLDKARLEIEKRVAGLETRKTQQYKSLAKLTEERFTLRDKAAQLSEKYEDLRDNHENVMSRIEAVLNAIQRRLPVTSDAEVRMQRQLQGVERKVKDLSNAVEQIKAKERYQMRQIKHSQENIKTRSEMTTSMGQNQVESMKDVLRQDGDQIANIVKRLNSLKKDLTV